MRNHRQPARASAFYALLLSLLLTLTPSIAGASNEADPETPPVAAEAEAAVAPVADCGDAGDAIEFRNGRFSIDCNSRSPLGINTNDVFHYSSAVPFTDLYRRATPFTVQTSNGQTPQEGTHYRFDNAGWPTFLSPGTKADTTVVEVIPEALVDGYYHVLYDGKGELSYHPSGSVDVRRIADGNHRVRIDPNSAGLKKLRITIESTNPADHLRNIRVIMPGGVCQRNPLRHVAKAEDCVRGDFMAFRGNHNGALRFNPDYLNFMKDFKVIRFMDMMATNSSPIKGWNHQSRIGDATWNATCRGCHAPVRHGVPLEVMIELANTLNADVWFNMPHEAYNGYVTRFANIVRRDLKPASQVYLEYTNETWNLIVYKPQGSPVHIVSPDFRQAEHVIRQGCANQPARCPNLTGDAVTLRQYFDVGVDYHVQRSIEISRIWEQAFSGQRQRLTRVLARQFRDPAKSTQALNSRFQGNRAADLFDALAVGPYFDISNPEHRSNTSNPFVKPRNLGEVFNRIVEDRGDWARTLRRQHEIAENAEVELLAYEAGHHLTVGKQENADLRQLYLAANRDRRLGDEYTVRNNIWRDVTNNTMNVMYTSPRAYNANTATGDFWGVKEHIRQRRNDAPKYNTIRSFIDRNPTN